jgi:murein DD-endopeptidase MepM/ murein hydrolase activator NlpD
MIRRALIAIAALALTAAAPEQESEHVVAPGETLGGIATRAKVPRVLIAEANRLQPPYTLKVGQKLLIPRTRHHTVAKGQTGLGIALDYGVPWSAIAIASGIDPKAAIRPGQKLLVPTILPVVDAPAASQAAAPRFAWPIAGPIRRGFIARGKSNHHDGLDITAPTGTAVRAAAAGKVIFAGEEPNQFGTLVLIDHGGGWHSAYAFFTKIMVKRGDSVSAGERVGLSGRSKGPNPTAELHFELRHENAPIDPRGLLPANT